MAKRKRKRAESPPKGTPSAGIASPVLAGRERISAAVLAVAVLLPVLGVSPAASQFVVVDSGAALAGLAGLAAAAVLALSGERPALARIGLAWAAFLLVALASAVLSQRGWTAFMGEATNMLGWGLLAALTVVALAAAARSSALRALLERWAWLVLLLECVAAFARLTPGVPATGTLPNSTIFGIVVLLLLPWTVVPGRRTTRIETRARLATALLAVAALAASGSRAALVVGVVWAVWTMWSGAGLTGRTRAIAIAAVVVVAVAAAAVFAAAEFETPELVQVVGERPAMWRMSSRAVAARPVLGWGPDGFLAGGSAISTVELATRERLLMLAPGATDPHDLLVWVAVSTGVLGLLAFVWFAAETVRAWRSRAWGVAPAVWAVAGAVVVYLTAPAAVQTLPLFALVLGVSLDGEARDAAARERRALPSWAVPAAAAALGLACALYAADALTRAPLETASAQASPVLAPRARSATATWRLDAHLAYLASLHLGYLGADPARPDLSAVRRAAALDRRSALYATELARTLRFHAEPTETVEAAYREVFRRYPAYPVARAEYAALLAAQGRREEAAEQFAIAGLVSAEGSAEVSRAVEAARAAIGTGTAGGEAP